MDIHTISFDASVVRVDHFQRQRQRQPTENCKQYEGEALKTRQYFQAFVSHSKGQDEQSMTKIEEQNVVFEHACRQHLLLFQHFLEKRDTKYQHD